MTLKVQVLALLFAILVSDVHGEPSPTCGWEETGGFAPAPTRSGVCNASVGVVLYTFPDVIAAGGGSEEIPSWADDMRNGFSEYVNSLALGTHDLDLEVFKRSGADSTKYWVLPYDHDEGTAAFFRSVVDTLLPDGWADSYDCVIYGSTARPVTGENRPTSSGRVCEGTGRIQIYLGDVVPPAGDWAEYDQHAVQGILCHEYGHSLGLGHLPHTENGENSSQSNGGYYACYAVMAATQYQGCPQATELGGFVPYAPFEMLQIGWLQPDTLAADSVRVHLRDVRLSGDGALVSVSEESNAREYFLLTNHQETAYDSILAGRGLAVWHYRAVGSSNTQVLIDLEHRTKLWESSTSFCRDHPPVEDNVTGVDSLDCSSQMLPAALFAGVASALTGDAFTPETNPSSHGYTGTPSSRRSEQSAATNVWIEDIRAEVDSLFSGKYVIRFDFELK